VAVFVSTNNGKPRFELHNSNDTTAKEIVDILNRYIPDKF